MSAEEDSIVERLTKNAQNEAKRTSELLTKKQLQSSQKSKENQHIEAKLLIDSEKKQSEIKKTNIFASKPTDAFKQNIFQAKKSVNLFQLTNSQKKTGNIFNLLSKPTVQVSQDDELLSQCSQKSEEKIEFKTQPQTKVMKYAYQSVFKKIFQFELTKFKSNQGAAKDNVAGSLEVKEDRRDQIHLFIRSKQTKIILFQALIMKDISKIEPFMNKKQNLKANVITQRRSFESNEIPVVQKDVVKMQFRSETDCNQFKQEINAYFSSEK